MKRKALHPHTGTEEKHSQVEQLLADERFKGRRQMLRDLAVYLSDFGSLSTVVGGEKQ